MLNQVLKCPQKHVNSLLRMLSKSATFNFHKVVQQYIAGVVEIFVVYT